MFTDPADPRTWFALMLRAIAGLHRGDQGTAVDYLKFVEAQRGRAQAEQARATLRVYAASEAFSNPGKLLHELEAPIAPIPIAQAAQAASRPAARRKPRGGGLIHPKPVQASLT